MTYKQIIIFIVFLMPINIYAQTNWKDLISQKVFSATENKNDIPLNLLKKIEIDYIEYLANPSEQWNSTCNPENSSPQIRLNWASWYKNYWIVSLSRGGYSIKTYYYFFTISSANVEVLSTRKSENLSFIQLKSYILKDQLKFD